MRILFTLLTVVMIVTAQKFHVYDEDGNLFMTAVDDFINIASTISSADRYLL